MPENLNLKTVETVDTRPFRKLVMTIGELPSAFVESMTYYELLAWFVNYLETVIIPTVNNNGEAVEELQDKFIELNTAFNQLKNYVDTYFENLDVQDEINNKLDQMAEDGTLQEIITDYLNTKAVFCFDTVTDMKAATNLIDGSYARTLGYYAINDGGAALYRIYQTEPAEYQETLTSSLYAVLIPENSSINVKQFGLAGDGTTDDTTKMALALNYAADHDLNVKMHGGDTYLMTTSAVVNKPNASIEIDGNDAAIKMNPTGRIRFLDITCDTFSIHDLEFNGDGSTQDQFDETSWDNVKIATPINITANNISVNNLNMRDWYGNGIRFFNYHNAEIDNILIDNVGGHWYQNNEYDAFGDALTFAGHGGEANINISNVSATGKYKDSTLSRIGLCFDFAANKTDTITNVNVENCNLINYDRGIHVENILGKMFINYQNGTNTSNVFIINYGNTVDQVYLTGDNLTINSHEGAYSGSHGVYNTTFDIKNSTINCQYTRAIAMFRATGTYKKCVFNNINQLLVDGSGTVQIIDSIVNLANSTSGNLNYNSDLQFINCVFNSSADQAATRAGSRIKFGSCTFNKFIPYYEPLDLNNTCNMSSDYSITATQIMDLMTATIYLGTTLLQKPNISKAFPIDDIELVKYFGTRNVPTDGTTIPLIPSFTGTYLRPNSKYILITVGHNGANVIQSGKNFDNYYLNIITTNSSSEATIGATTTVGNPSTGGFNFTIDTTNGTLAKAGNYATIAGQWLLPYYYKDYLKNQ